MVRFPDNLTVEEIKANAGKPTGELCERTKCINDDGTSSLYCGDCALYSIENLNKVLTG